MVFVNRTTSLIGDKIERRKRQNRLRQKAWRERRQATHRPRTIISVNDDTWKGFGLLMFNDHSASETAAECSVTTTPTRANRLVQMDVQLSLEVGDYRKKSSGLRLIPPLLPYASFNTTTQALSSPITFPLSADHCLITLVQYNVIRATLFNISILSKMDSLPLGCGRQLQIPRFAVSPNMIPSDLQPSSLQKSQPHLFWIDAIPFPKVRDNMIRMAGMYDSDDLLYDLGRGLYDGFDDVERRGFVVWGDSWDAKGWEVTEGFIRKWGFLLVGCEDVIEETNRLRERRGEERLVVEL